VRKEDIMGANENRAIVQKLYQAFGKGDIKTIMSLLSPSISWQNYGPTSVPTYVPCKGHEAVQKWFGALMAEFEIGEFVPETFLADGDHVVVLGIERGKVRKTSRPYSTRFAQVYTLKGSQIVRYDGFDDSHAIAFAFTGK
jgi:uncharacterized protein